MGRKPKLEPTKNTPEEIEAAVNAYYDNGCNPQKVRVPVVGESIEDIEKKHDADEKEVIKKCNEGCECGHCKDPYTIPEEPKSVSIEISASECYLNAKNNPDGSITNYILGINQMINDESNKGGYSVSVKIRVTQKDWVNVQHIVDWYRARGFEILNYDVGTTPYGRDSGMMMYNFTISWANACK